MNKTTLKNFAINARLELLARVKDRAALYGITEEKVKAHELIRSNQFQKLGGEMLTRREIEQRNALIGRVMARGYGQAVEEAAYTWFNRFIALRYMQAHNLLPVDMLALPQFAGELPQIVREAQNVELEGVDIAAVMDMLDNNRTEALYKYLLIALCNALSEPLPQMFEAIEDYTELLFPDGILKAESVLGMLAKVEADNWQDIQVIGWLYQYYITDTNALVYDGSMSKSRIPKELLPAATQIFTPDWVVKYMVENSLGRLWLEGHPDDSLRRKWRYYMDEAEQTPDVAAQLQELRKDYADLQPELITLLDPCMGSGHILVYAFDVLMDIYRSRGYTDRDAVQSIVTNNLFGLDIDDRAGQLAYFAIMMKACEYDRRFLRRNAQPHVCAIQESPRVDMNVLDAFGPDAPLAKKLYATFIDAKEYGSILHVDLTEAELQRISHRMMALHTPANADDLAHLGESMHAIDIMAPLVKQAKIMTLKYDVVFTNPPYLSSSRLSEKLNRFVVENYPEGKADLSATMYLKSMNDFAKKEGFISFITITSWMFLSSFEKYRVKVLNNQSIVNLVDFGSELFEGKVGHNLISAWIARNIHVNSSMTAVRLVDYNYSQRDKKENEFFNGQNRHTVQQENFTKIPGMPVAYWINDATLAVFTHMSLSEYGWTSKGIITGDNTKFLRLWYEVNMNGINYTALNYTDSITSNLKWYPCNKGGDYRKWYGNNTYIINWYKNGNEIMQRDTKKTRNCQDYRDECKFVPSITWSSISSSKPSFRLSQNALSESAGMTYFVEENKLWYSLGFLNSKAAAYLLSVINPTLNFTAGAIGSLPLVNLDAFYNQINDIVNQIVQSEKNDWDSFETSWDFQCHPMI